MAKEGKGEINLDVVQDIISTVKMLREKYSLTWEEMGHHMEVVHSAMKTIEDEDPPTH